MGGAVVCVAGDISRSNVPVDGSRAAKVLLSVRLDKERKW